MIHTKQRPSNSPNLNALQISYLGAMLEAFSEASSEASYSLWVIKVTLEKHGEIFRRTKLS